MFSNTKFAVALLAQQAAASVIHYDYANSFEAGGILETDIPAYDPLIKEEQLGVLVTEWTSEYHALTFIAADMTARLITAPAVQSRTLKMTLWNDST